MFRHVQLKIGRVDLGAPLPSAIVDAARIQPGTRVADLPTGSFSRAQRIRLRLSQTGVVVSVEFEYAADADFEKMIDDYVSWGAPTRASERTGDVSVDTAEWSDAATAFVLRREVSSAGSRIVGELRDAP
jgi:hypothetical protein